MKVILLLVILQSLCSSDAQEDANQCYKLREKTCSKCLEIPGCAWCSYQNYNASRCSTEAKLLKSSCPRDHIINLKAKTERVESSGQMTPQRAVLTARVGEPITFDVEVKVAKDHPVDFYYLLDLSLSMDKDLKTLKSLALKIADKLKQLTSKFRLAFGSFVDKPTPPYLAQDSVGKPFRDGYAVSYDFKHVADFTDNAREFQQSINNELSSGSRDVPEGTLDALLQVAACEEELGWRAPESTRRIVLIATDAPFHMAGEGKLGGITKPHDGKCHLEIRKEGRFYSKSLELDYPSVNQVYRVLRNSKIQPIFAASKRSPGAIDLFKQLKQNWKNLTPSFEVLREGSENIVELIENSYKKIASTVRLTYETREGITLDIKSNCGDTVTKSIECIDVGLGKNVSFQVRVTATTCKNGNFSSFKLVAAGFGEVTVDVNVLCSCPCEDKKDSNSSFCSGHGALVCGGCECDPGWSGQRCECDQANAGDSIGEDQCIMPNTTGNIICDGNGECFCGVCQCRSVGDTGKKYYGDYCQCSDSNCEQYEGEQCGGEKRGVCKCSKCVCEKGFTGSNCGEIDCSLKISDCLDDDKVNCSGHGQCDCGVCKCDSFYQGALCDTCPSCTGRCDDYKQCVLCHVFGEVPDNETLCLDCPPIKIKKSREELDLLELPELCKYKDDDGCGYLFTYGNEKGNETATIFAIKEKDCPEGPNVLLIVLGVIGGIVLIGLALLILWKILILMVDRREYQKFEKDRAKSRWTKESNPLYKPATSTTQNPIFAGRRY